MGGKFRGKAHSAIERGFTVVPMMHGKKQPHIAWKGLTPAESLAKIDDWGVEFPSADVGVLTGSRSGGLIVVDIDTDHGGVRPEGLPATLTATTPSGGEHLYFTTQEKVGIINRQGLEKGLDIRAEGGLVVAPLGTGRDWVNPDVEITVLPDEWVKWVRKYRKVVVPRGPKYSSGANESEQDLFNQAEAEESRAEKAMENIRTAWEGTRNGSFNVEVFKLAASGADMGRWEEPLCEAAESSGMSQREVRATYRSASRSGVVEWEGR